MTTYFSDFKYFSIHISYSSILNINLKIENIIFFGFTFAKINFFKQSHQNIFFGFFILFSQLSLF